MLLCSWGLKGPEEEGCPAKRVDYYSQYDYCVPLIALFCNVLFRHVNNENISFDSFFT